MDISTHTAIQGVCAWPNLQKLPDGSLLATIFNQPCHGKWEGDLDCWISEDGGETWRFHGRPAPHEPKTNRMNCAVGYANNGDLIVLCSGWNNRLPAGQPAEWTEGTVPLTPWISRSSDGGKTWEVSEGFPDQPGGRAYIPFGNILPGDDGHLRAFVYGRRDPETNKGIPYAVHAMTSRDDGATWSDPVLVNDRGNETMAIHLGDGKWLAASREEADKHVHLLASDDDAKTWIRKCPLSLPRQVNGHLLKLSDDRLALTYGNRCLNNCGVDLRFSEDGGETWSVPIRLADADYSDCGYPSTIQRADGACVTAWYTKISGEFNYEMRVTTWTP